MSCTLVTRLLRRYVSVAQTAGYIIAALVGLSIVLSAVQFYRDASGLFDSDTAMGRDYLVLSKQIGLNKRDASFTAEELASLESQPWVDSIGAFTASRFRASIGVDFAGKGMTTEAFFESIPDEFFDRLPDDWHFSPATGEVPIVLSRDYLALYNFGFAASRGLPTLRESEIGLIPLVITLTDRNGSRVRMRGHVAGFSSRINTIAVPEEFMKWANDNFGNGADAMPARVVVRVNTPGDPAINTYMERNGLEIAGDKADNSTAAYFLRVATAAVSAIGAVISALALFILLLSMYLLLQKNRDKLHQMMLLGYSPTQVSVPYVIFIVVVNAAVWILACAATALVSTLWRKALATLSVAPAGMWPTLLAGAGIMCVLSVVCIIAVRTTIRKDF
ncbi:MAG: ABC transporter permease [Muribaculaceae bacterium]|nr:ABC transporter permease [Muribaculaceae bacterium]